MYATSLLSRFMQNPSQIHFGVAKRILRYLQGTIDYGIWYKPTTDPRLFGYTNSDWAGSVDDMKSTSGYAFTNGLGIFSWSSKKQETVAQSSAEAEIQYFTARQSISPSSITSYEKSKQTKRLSSSIARQRSKLQTFSLRHFEDQNLNCYELSKLASATSYSLSSYDPKPLFSLELTENENGGAGVYSASLKKNYILANDEWKKDLMPEILDGHNVYDFVDPDNFALA
ncbi:hypothetical protein L3X38_027174 [Prunus dulcis]|uniref:NOG C-terminal domain-containing protein n=1 Tax=Prunus dulcis TaxID=3755 RepID=A0AAD4VNN6_PRUDU|nr:hypothetical protein L3X38_027174 [Prunus dulcis]